MKKIQKITSIILAIGIILANVNMDILYAESKDINIPSLDRLNIKEDIKYSGENFKNVRANNSDSNMTIISDRVYSYNRYTWIDNISKDRYWKYTLNIGGTIRTITINESSSNYNKALDRLEYIKRQIDNNIFLQDNSKNGIKKAIKNELAYLELTDKEENKLADTIMNALENSSQSAVSTIAKIIVDKTPDQVKDVLDKAYNRSTAIISICFGVVSPINATNIKNAFSIINNLDLQPPTIKPTIAINKQLYTSNALNVTLTGTASGSNRVEIFYSGKKTIQNISGGKYTSSIYVDNSRSNIDIYVAGVDSCGNRGPYNQITLKKNTAPVITASDKTTTVGKAIDLLSGVKAKDAEEGDLTKRISISYNNVNFNKVGKYSITYSVCDKGGIKSEKTISVIVEPQKIISVTGISLNKKNMTIINGNTVKLTSTVSPSNATNKAVTWSSSNPKVAIVDQNGNVRGISAGKAKITAKTKDGSKVSICDVTVNNYLTDKTVTFSINVPRSFNKKHYIDIIDTNTNKIVYTSGLRTGSRTLTFRYTLPTINTSCGRKIRIRLENGKIFDTNTFYINKNTIGKKVIATYQSSINGNVKCGSVTQK